MPACVGDAPKHAYCIRYSAPYDVCGWIAQEGRCGCGGVIEIPTDLPTGDSGPQTSEGATFWDVGSWADPGATVDGAVTVDLAAADLAVQTDPSTASSGSDAATQAAEGGSGSGCTSRPGAPADVRLATLLALLGLAAAARMRRSVGPRRS